MKKNLILTKMKKNLILTKMKKNLILTKMKKNLILTKMKKTVHTTISTSDFNNNLNRVGLVAWLKIFNIIHTVQVYIVTSVNDVIVSGYYRRVHELALDQLRSWLRCW